MTRHDKIKKIIKKLDQNNFSNFPLLPFAIRIASHTIGIGGEPEERIEKRSRIQKLKRILSDEEFSEIIDEETYKEILEFKPEGLLSVQPLSAPIGHLMYVDYIYKSPDEKKVKMNWLKKLLIWFKNMFNKFKSNKKKSETYGLR
ncbi:hypothetical protein M0Q97_05170 [Candidatus Dojkabacteria bacterium]|jgi:hypothetical protein|nr:hypothetical protein [Candidatus Dojkabacteria bacterium]